MAEISYPFDDDTPGGGTKAVSSVEWQRMSQLWSGDRIDFQLTEKAYTITALPFHAALVGPNLVIQPGSAWVGGFYYRNTAALSKPAPTNSGTLPRVDRIVLRTDMASGSVNLEIKTGTPSANPAPPALERTPGGIWEMGLWNFTLAANNGARVLVDARYYKGPETIYTPWNAPQASEGLPQGQFLVDMDSDNSYSQWEAFSGRDGFVVSRTLGKSMLYTPTLPNGSPDPSASARKGRWRWDSPNTYWFSVNIAVTKAVNVTGSGSSIGIGLPVVTNKRCSQTLHGFITNPNRSNGMPNAIAVTAVVSPGANAMYLYAPNSNNVGEGLDNLGTLPANSHFFISGVLEANIFDE